MYGHCSGVAVLEHAWLDLDHVWLENFWRCQKLGCSHSPRRIQTSSCENVCSLISGEIGWKYMCLQLVEELSPDIVFVLGAGSKCQCKWRYRRASKQANIDYSFVFVMGHMCLLFIPNKSNVVELACCVCSLFSPRNLLPNLNSTNALLIIK